MRGRIRSAAAVIAGGLALSCHDPASPSASALFSVSPIDVSTITQLVPLGNLNPPGHTLATNHMYFYHLPVSAVVTAPAGGKITEVRHDADDALYVQATSQVLYYFGHLLLDAGIATGGTVTAGQRLGVTVAVGAALDLGVSNDDVSLFFVRPDRYIPMTIHADSPLKYFAEPARSTLYGMVQRQGADKDGKINYDVTDRLAGNWFLSGTPASNSESVDNGPRQLSFARDVTDPTINVVSIGGTLTSAGVFYLDASAPDPATISIASGRIGYVLFSNSLRTGTNNSLLIVQLIANDQIRVQVLPPGTPASADFTAAAVTYTR